MRSIEAVAMVESGIRDSGRGGRARNADVGRTASRSRCRPWDPMAIGRFERAPENRSRGVDSRHTGEHFRREAARARMPPRFSRSVSRPQAAPSKKSNIARGRRAFAISRQVGDVPGAQKRARKQAAESGQEDA